MILVEFIMKGGAVLYARADAVHAWTQNVEDKEYASVWIGGRRYDTIESVEKVTKKMVQAD